MKKILISILIIYSTALAQSKQEMKNFKPNTPEVRNRLEKIYRNLEYNTAAFNDLKNKWIVTDPLYVREIYNQCLVNNALKIDGKKVKISELKKKTGDIYNGDVFIELRKRYYDDEIEELRFFTESKYADTANVSETRKDYFFDTITDNVYIKNILGEDLYKDLSRQFYAHTDITKDTFGNKEAYNFDIYMHLFKSYVMFWSLTTQRNNKYLLSLSSSWGNNNIILPGWYYPDLFLGLKLSYVDYIRNNEPYLTYYIEVASGIPVKFPRFDFNKDEFGPRLFHTGNNLFVRVGSNPFGFISESMKHLNLTIEGMISLTENKTEQYRMDYLSQFFSNRNFAGLNFKYTDLFNFLGFGWFYASAGYSVYDIYHYLYNPDVTNLKLLDSNIDNIINAEIGIQNSGNLLQHKIALSINHNYSSKYTYAGLKAKFMINNIFGFEFEFYTNIYKSGKLPFYRIPTYITFSPIIRINY